MATSTLISKACEELDRTFLLTKLGLDASTSHFFFFPNTGPLQFAVSEKCRTIHQDDVPFLYFGNTTQRCEGAKLVRYKRTTVAVPCFSEWADATSSLCLHCNDLWSFPNEDNQFVLDNSMTKALPFYQPGAFRRLTNLPAIKVAEMLFKDNSEKV